MSRTYKFKVSLNGTDENPFHKFGLKCNPFPQIGRAEFDSAERRVRILGGDPIPHDTYEEYIRTVLRGFTKEFVDLCVEKFRPGEYVEFVVEFPE